MEMLMVGGALVNVILVLVLAPLFEGLIRKLKAVIQSRKGPPVTQPYRDILKLLGKENLQVNKGLLLRAAPVLSLGAILVAAALTPIGGAPPLGRAGDMIAWIYVMSMAAIAVMLGAFSSGNPYSYAGASREMMMLLSAEPVAIIALLTAGFKSGTLEMGSVISYQLSHGPTVSLVCAGVAFFLALQANIGRLPFDIPEAESEIIEGPFLEYSGPRLALFKWAFYIRQLIFSLMLVSVFVPWPAIGAYAEPSALAYLLTLAKTLVVFGVIGLIDSVTPRLRIDQAMTYMSRVVFVALAALAFASIGV
jgi:formate hydrogenlyase subunit 4